MTRGLLYRRLLGANPLRVELERKAEEYENKIGSECKHHSEKGGGGDDIYGYGANFPRQFQVFCPHKSRGCRAALKGPSSDHYSCSEVFYDIPGTSRAQKPQQKYHHANVIFGTYIIGTYIPGTIDG